MAIIVLFVLSLILLIRWQILVIQRADVKRGFDGHPVASGFPENPAWLNCRRRSNR
jgi:hypothetical protein